MENNPEGEPKSKGITRREFLKGGLAVLGGLALESCRKKIPLGAETKAQGSPTPARISPEDASAAEISTPAATRAPEATPTSKPTKTPTFEPTRTPELIPTSKAAIEIEVNEMGFGGENEILNLFDIVRLPVSEADIEAKNAGIKLLTTEGYQEQFFVKFQKEGRTRILANFNLPFFEEGEVQSQPVFNTASFRWLMGWVDNNGKQFYHIPIQEGVEDLAPVVYQKGTQICEGLVELKSGVIKSEKPYWQKIPLGSERAIMSRYENAIYVTFWDRRGNQLEDKRIKICELPVESSPKEGEMTTTEVKVGETVLGNEIKMEILSQERKEANKRKNVVFIVGGIHHQENTGWFAGDSSNPGWLALVKKWLEENKEEWKGMEIAMVDINPDGRGRGNPNGVDLNRNFACKEVCNWHETDPNTRSYNDPDGPSAMSEPESKALISATEFLKKRNEVLFMVSLHNVAPPSGLIDPGYCGEDGRSCEIAQEIAQLSGARYEEIWPSGDPNYPEGLGGQPIDYFSLDMGIPAADYEFSQREPNVKEANRMAKALIKAVKRVYNLNP